MAAYYNISDESDAFYWPSRNPNRGGGSKPYISGKLPTYPSPKPTLTLASHLCHNVGLGEEQVSSFLETYNDPRSIKESRGNFLSACKANVAVKI